MPRHERVRLGQSRRQRSSGVQLLPHVQHARNIPLLLQTPRVDARDHHSQLGVWKRTVGSNGGNETIIGRKPLSIAEILPIFGLSYFAAFAIALILRSLISSGSLASYQFFFVPLAAIAILCSVAIWLKPRTGYPAAVAMSIVLMAIFFLTKDGNDVITVLSNPTRNYVQFAFYLTAVPQFFSTLIFSLLGLWRTRTPNKEANLSQLRTTLGHWLRARRFS